MGGKLGSLAGDLGGASLARRAIEDAKVTRATLKNIKSKTPNFDSLSVRDKTKLLLQEANLEKQRRNVSRTENLLSDTTGWAIGNSAAETINQIPIVGNLPLTGAGVAIPSTKRVVDNINAARRGEMPVKQAIVQSAKDIAVSPIQTYKRGYQQGIAREKAMYDRGNQWLRQQLGRQESNFSFMSNLVFI